MSMKYLYSLLLILFVAGCTSDEVFTVDEYDDIVPLTGVEAKIAGSSETRADKLTDYVGRSEFVSGDNMVLTTMRRTIQGNVSAIPQFNYTNLEFNHNGGGWKRDESKGKDGNNATPSKIYWSDSKNPHTYIGYSTPKVAGFDWEKKGTVFYGSLGDPTSNGSSVIDYYTSGTSTGNTALENDDILVSYHTNQKADEGGGAMVTLTYHHALANVRVVVNITGFSSGPESDDNKAVVSEMTLKDMLTMYKWDSNPDLTQEELKLKTPWVDGNVGAEALTEADQTNLPSGVNWNQKKDTKLWIPNPTGKGTGASRTFTFYALAVPTKLASGKLKFSFKVTYPDAMNPTQNVEKTYSASVNQEVEFRAGHCTTLNISLNHRNEQMTVGAEYMNWQFIDIPDQGELYKNSTFMEHVDRSKITIVGDENATEDDATWLYEKNGQIVDIYGNDGNSRETAYTISTAEQLLSFAYEVKNGRSFEGKFVKLDANITMQKKTTAQNTDPDNISDGNLLKWVGIGSADNPFNGTFLGEKRYVTLLHGAPLFSSIGPKAQIELLGISSTAGSGVVSGSGLLADTNAGTLNGCYAVGSINTTSTSAVGGLVGANSGTISACYHQGTIIAAADKGGIAGTNSGSIIGCYSAGGQYDNKSAALTDHDTPPSSTKNNGGITSSNSGTVSDSYYSNTLVSDNVDISGIEGKTSGSMQKEAFVTDYLNLAFDNTYKYGFAYSPAKYPTIGLYNESGSSSNYLRTGFYRVNNFGSKRYVYITDDNGTFKTDPSLRDLHAIVLKKASNNDYLSDPASIIYVKNVKGSKPYVYNLYSQGADVNTITGYNVAINARGGHYTVGAVDEVTWFRELLVDASENNTEVYGTVGTTTEEKDNRQWDAVPVDVSSANYFGVVPTVTVPDTETESAQYYAPFYADFGFTVSDGMEVYYVSALNIADGVTKASLKKITGTVPAKTPVIIKCKSANVSDNRLNLIYSNASPVAGNELKGNMFNNGNIPNIADFHKNQVSYAPATMRMLDVDTDGNLVFVKKTDLDFLPANQSYLKVSEETSEDPITVEIATE